MSITDEINAISDKAFAIEQENERLRTENEYLTQTMDGWVERRDETLKIMEDSLKEALETPQQTEAMTKLLDLIQEDIEGRERVINNSARIVELIETYRSIRPI